MVNGFKHTDVGPIPVDWTVKNIVETSTLKARIGWQGLTVAEYLDNGDYFLITGTDFIDNKIKWESCYYVNKDRYLQDKNIQIKIEDILITKDGTIGKIAFIDSLPANATLNSGVFVIRPKGNSYLPKFLFYIFNSFYFRDFLSQLVAGSTVIHLYQKDFVGFNFPLPPTKSEQTAIATVLSDTDALIAHLEKLIAKKKAIKQGAMRELLRPKEGWEVKKLGELTIIIGGGTPSSFISNYWNGEINWFTPTEIGEDKYTFKSKRKISSEGLMNSSAKLLPIGTILLTSRASIGELSILMVEGCTNQGFQSLIVKSDNNNEFLYYMVQTLKPIILQNSSGSTFLEISPNKLRSIEVPVPAYEMQTQISRILADMDLELLQLNKQLDKYKVIKQGMMQVLLTGKIRLI